MASQGIVKHIPTLWLCNDRDSSSREGSDDSNILEILQAYKDPGSQDPVLCVKGKVNPAHMGPL